MQLLHIGTFYIDLMPPWHPQAWKLGQSPDEDGQPGGVYRLPCIEIGFDPYNLMHLLGVMLCMAVYVLPLVALLIWLFL